MVRRKNKYTTEVARIISCYFLYWRSGININKNHPGKLCAIWYDLPVSGICIETGKQVNFFFGNILWDMEGIVDGGISIYIDENGEINDVVVHHKSLTLLFPDKTEEMTPLQRLAFSALPFSHWDPENDN